MGNMWQTFKIGEYTKGALLTCGSAIYIDSTPGHAIDHWNSNNHKSAGYPWKKSHSDGRWLFPHSKGTRAAYEHMKNTTLEDDWHTLQQQHDISNNPDVLATFSFL